LNFNEFGFDATVLEGIAAIGYEQTTPVQEMAIPIILQGKDLIASAQTGTGKTAAFLLPIINKIITLGHHEKIKALIIVPTRELASQIDQNMEGFSYFTNVSSIAVFGGTDGATFTREKQALTEGADVVICTPGRMIAHLNMGYVDFSSLQFLVLDEADRMLDMGFFDDIMKIISYLPKERQTVLCSATMPSRIRDLSKRILKNPEEVSIAVSKPIERIRQIIYSVNDAQKVPLICSILKDQLQLRTILVFCSTKSKTKQVSAALKKLKLSANEIHSDLDQVERENVLLAFKSRELKILVATDIMSRGIDIEDIDMVINYDVPHDGEDYIHRIGRTARAAAEGVAITFVSSSDHRKFQAIEKLLEKKLPMSALPEDVAGIKEDPSKREHQKKRSFRPQRRRDGESKGSGKPRRRT